MKSFRSKGSQFELDVAYNLSKVDTDVRRLYGEGQVLQYDIESKNYVVECKFHKSISWNEAMKYFLKLKEKTKNKNKIPLLIFKSNRQPVLVMFELHHIFVVKFEDFFHIKFESHLKAKKNKIR